MQDQPKKTRHFWRNALALACGILTGVVLAVSKEMWDLFQLWLAHKQPSIFTRVDWALIYLEFAAAYAIGIALVATVIWWIWGPALRRRLVSALGLGFILTAAAWLMSEMNMLEYLSTYEEAAYFAVMGAIAGAVTWWISHPRRKNLFVALD